MRIYWFDRDEGRRFDLSAVIYCVSVYIRRRPLFPVVDELRILSFEASNVNLSLLLETANGSIPFNSSEVDDV